jgi:D-alanyl-D-alanine carboxypeptidase
MIYMGMVNLLRIICCFCLLVGQIQGAIYTAVITELKTGNILAQSSAHIPVYPASLTKLMTLYLLFQSLEQGLIHMDTLFKVSSFAARQPPSNWGLKPGSRISVHQCILALSVKSCNDVAHVVSENLYQSTELFVKNMNAMALKLGMLKTVFYNPSGWHHRLQKTTAHNMAILMRAICINFPEYSGFLGVPSIKKGNRVIRNTNKLLGRVPGLYLGKTGYTCPSGYNLVTVTSRNNQPIVVVVMGMPSKIQRDQLMASLIETCYKDPRRLHLAIAKPLNTLSGTPHLVLAKLIKPRRTKQVKKSKIGNKNRISRRETVVHLAKINREKASGKHSPKSKKSTKPLFIAQKIRPQRAKKRSILGVSRGGAIPRKVKGRAGTIPSKRITRKRQSLIKRAAHQKRPSSSHIKPKKS